MNTLIYKNTALFLLAGLAACVGKIGANPKKHEINQHMKTEDVAYLGVYTTDLSPTLTHQLGFPKGFYLTIHQVDAGSPADKAGLQKHDILQKIDDQIIINADQLRELIRSKEAGVNVGIQYFRGGSEHTASAKLTTRKVTAMMPMGRVPQDFFPKDFLHKGWPKTFNQNSHTFKYDFDSDFDVSGPQTKTFSITNDETSVQINDDHGSLALDIKGKVGKLTIRDKSGDTLYDGEYKVGQKLKELPEHWQKRLKGIDDQLSNQNIQKNARPKNSSSKGKSKKE